MLTYELTGINDLNDMLADLGLVLGKRVVRKSARKAMTPVLHAIQNNAPVDAAKDDGIHLKDSFKLQVGGRTKKNQRDGEDTFLTAKVASTKEVGQYIAQIEFGRAENTLTRNNVFGISRNPFQVHMKALPANPFMGDTFESMYTSVVTTFTDGIIEEIDNIKAKKQRKARSAFRAKERRARKVARGK